MKKEIPQTFLEHLNRRSEPLVSGEGLRGGSGWKGVGIGVFLSLILAVGAPYGNMIIRGSYMALDFSTPGAIFLFLVLIGLLNFLFKIAGRSQLPALGLALLCSGAWGWLYWPFAADFLFDPGFLFVSCLLIVSLANIAAVRRGETMALGRADLIVVYTMLLIVSALCTMGLSEQLLPMITGLFYYASPENKWAEKLIPHLPQRPMLVDDGNNNMSFYEGGVRSLDGVPLEAWAAPLFWWAVFLIALYLTMVSVAVLFRRQWMERERLAYPIAQVGLAMVRGEEEGKLVNSFIGSRAMWFGCALPLLVGSLKGLHKYDPSVPMMGLSWHLPFFGSQNLQLTVSFAMVGFSYLINANIAAGIWFFHLLSKFEKELFIQMGLKSSQKVIYGVADFPLMAYQGVGALIAMVLVGLWVGREHLGTAWRKAVGLAPEVDDSDEIISYRSAVFGTIGGMATMVGWLWLMGTPLWVAAIFVVVAIIIFIGITRIVAEAGLAALRSPMIAPDLVVQGLGANLVGQSGVFNLSMTYIWAADVRVFVMANCANALRLIQEMPSPYRRRLFSAVLLALVIGALGSLGMIFQAAYFHGGINLDAWFFKGSPETAYNAAVRNMGALEVYWPGWAFFLGGGALMLLLMWARQQLPWWPVHPLGFPLGANRMMSHVWFSVFLAWALKKMILRFGGVALYRRSQSFFLGLIAGQALCNGIWLVIDYFTGKVGNGIFWV